MKITELDSTARERVREICQELFHGNYITEFVFAPNESLKKANADYSFVLAHYSAIEELLDYVGWRLRHDERAGVLYLSSDFPRARVTLTKIESCFLLVLRLLYDEKKTQAAASGEVFVTVRDIVERLNILNALGTITRQDRKKALSALSSKNIIARLRGKWEELDTRLAILPSIVCAISHEKLKGILEIMKTQAEEEADEEEEEES